MQQTGTAGNRGEGVRSDAYVSIELRQSGGIDIELKSRVMTLYGQDILTQARNDLDTLGIRHARIFIDDAGALPFVISARIEAAVKSAIECDSEVLPRQLDVNLTETTHDRNRFSRLYLPGNTPRLMINAGIHQPDGVILDLEDAVAPDRKHEARFVVRNALRALDFYGAERMVRINQVPEGLADLAFVIPHYVNLVLIPKCEVAAQVHLVNNEIQRLLDMKGVSFRVWLMPIIESALGIMNAFEIASAAPNVVAMAIGLEDYTADLGVRRTAEGTESFYARSAVVNACKAAGIQPIDSVFSDVGDMDGLRDNVHRSKALGFEGMGCIHPRQIAVIHEGFAPATDEIERAMKIVMAFDKAKERGLGVVALGTKMIDAPVVRRALHTIELAQRIGKLQTNWKESYEQNP